MRNEIGVEKVDNSKSVCELCDLRIGQFKIIISNRKQSELYMDVILCDECFEEFIGSCNSMIDNGAGNESP